MTILSVVLSQMATLFSLILIGYCLGKWRKVPEETSGALAKLETNLLIPAIILGTFIEHFTLDKLGQTITLFCFSSLLCLVMIALAGVCGRWCSKDTYTQKLYTYGLAFSNFGFMGNAIVSAVFPDMFFSYLIFSLPLWIMTYLWGVPTLLLPYREKGPKQWMETFQNPMYLAVLAGILIGIANVPIPTFLSNVISTCGNCMSPVAMLLTGIVVSKTNLKTVFASKSIYLVSTIRLLVFPVLFILITKLLPISTEAMVCAVCSLAMPLGLNTIVIPGAYQLDTSTGMGMTIISHILSCVTIPLVFMLMLG